MKGGKCEFAASASCQCVNGESRHSNSQESGDCAAVRKAAPSPFATLMSCAASDGNGGHVGGPFCIRAPLA